MAVALILFMVLSIPVFAITYFVCGNHLYSWMAWAILPGFLIVYNAKRAIKYATASPADFRYSHDVLRGGLNLRPSEDQVMRIVDAVHAMNVDAAREAEAIGEEQQQQRVYPCSMAVPEEVWRKHADRTSRTCDLLVQRASELPPAEAAPVLVRAALGYSGITMGMRFNSSSYNKKAIPLLPRILDILESKDPALQEDMRLACLQEVASISSQLNEHKLACRAYDPLLAAARSLLPPGLPLAILLSNYAYSADRANQKKLARALRTEAKDLWKEVPEVEVERHMLPE